ncbi:hypothetical protein INR49_014343 [Caranx melampygus]|nr:hypothetical protein INR49_014343 [Caranx melampygus]
MKKGARDSPSSSIAHVTVNSQCSGGTVWTNHIEPTSHVACSKHLGTVYAQDLKGSGSVCYHYYYYYYHYYYYYYYYSTNEGLHTKPHTAVSAGSQVLHNTKKIDSSVEDAVDQEVVSEATKQQDSIYSTSIGGCDDCNVQGNQILEGTARSDTAESHHTAKDTQGRKVACNRHDNGGGLGCRQEGKEPRYEPLALPHGHDHHTLLITYSLDEKRQD